MPTDALYPGRMTRAPKPIKHGTAGGYSNQGCRCASCRAAWADYMRPRLAEWRAKRKAERVASKG